MKIALATVRQWDHDDPIRRFRRRFELPPGIVYLDGNSLGALSLDAHRRLEQTIRQEWGRDLIRSWNTSHWIEAPQRVGAKIARLLGANSNEVVVADSTSVNLFKLIFAALNTRPERSTVLSEPGNFPTDLYVIQGAIRAASRPCKLRLEAPENLLDAIDSDTALVVLTHVHYKTAALHDMQAITARAHEHGALVLWDLSHSVGALAVDLDACNADMAVGCGYKYLNGGPGAPSFLFLAARHHDAFISPLSGWMGHSTPFEFADGYVPASGIRRLLCGTPPVLGLAGLEAGVDLMLECGLAALVEKSRRLSELFIELVSQRCPLPALPRGTGEGKKRLHSLPRSPGEGWGGGIQLISPRDPTQRGSHVSFTHPHGYEVMQALIERGVIGDFRTPNILRFGFAPLYTSYEDIWIAAETLADVLASDCWADPRYSQRAAVT